MSSYAEKYEKWKKKRDKEEEQGLRYGVEPTKEPETEELKSYGEKVDEYRKRKAGNESVVPESAVPESQVFRTKGDAETYRKFMEYQNAAEAERKKTEERKKSWEAAKIPKVQNRMLNTGVNPMHSQMAAGMSKPLNLRTDEEKIIRDNQEKREWMAENRAKREEKYADILAKASEVTKAPDFVEKSKYKKSGVWLQDIDYEYVNNPEMTKASLTEANGGVTPQTRKGYDYVKEEERAIYNYIYNTEGKKKANEYLEALNLEERMAKDTIEWNREYAKEKPVQASVTSVLSNLANAGQGYMEGVAGNVSGYGIDIDSYGNVQRRASNAIRETVAEGIESPVGKFFYQTGMSMADSVTAQIAASGLAMLGLPPAVGSSFILATNAATDGMISAKERGVSDDQALLTGLTQGGAEWFFEKISLGNLEILKETSPNTLKQLVKNVLKQGGVEGSEEVFTSIANAITDGVINKEQSELNLMKQYYISQGLSEEEAEKQVKKDFAKQIGMDFLGGFVSGTTMSTAVSSFNYALNKMDEKDSEIAGTLSEETEMISEESEMIPEQTEMIPEESEMIPEKFEMEEAQMYAGEQGKNAAEIEIAPAQNIEENRGILEEAESKSEGEKIIDTVLENGNISDNFADEIVKNENLRKAFEAKTGITIRGNQTEQRNTVKVAARTYAESHTGNAEQKKTAQNTSVTTPARQNATVRGKGVEIVGVETENGSELKFKDSSGNSYTTSEVKFADGVTQKLYGAAAEIAMVSDSETANSFVQHYETSMPIQYYAIGFDRFYSLGKMGVPKATALKSLDFLVSNTSEEAMMNAWNLGNQSRENDRAKVEVKKEKQKRKGTGTYEDQTRNFNANAALQTLVANRTGIDITREAGTDENTNGYFVPSMMQMVISDKATNEYATLIHELGEFGLAYNRSDMKELQNMLLRYQAEQSGIKGVGEISALVKAYQRLYAEREGSKTYEQAVDEMVNDALAGLFSSDEGVDQFVEWLQKDSGYSKAEQKSLVQQLMDLLDHIVKYLKTLVKEGRQSAAALKAAELEAARVEELRTKFLAVLDTAIENANTTGEYETEGNVKFSLKNKYITPNTRIPFVVSTSYLQVAPKDYATLRILRNKVKNIKKGNFENKATGYKADINSTTIQKILSPTQSFNPWNAKYNYIKNLNASLYLSELFENAVYIDSKPPQKAKNVGKQIKEYHHFVAPIEMDNSEYRVLITAREKVNSNTLYVVKAEIIPNNKRGASVGGQKPTNMIGAPRTITITDLVTGVNIYDYNLQQNQTYTDKDIKYSFAGVDAVTADKSMLELANEMEQRGEDSETIRKQTGWHKGYDGRWRFEIDDSQMEIRDIESNYMRLDQLLKHDKLFEAYPMLREIDVVFQNIKEYGSFNRQFYTINLNYELKNNPERLKQTLMHEIQHAIQYEEGFAGGASTEYWEGRLSNGFDSRPKDVQRQEWKLRKQYLDLKESDPEFVDEMENLRKMTPNVPRGEFNFDTWEKITEDPIEWQEYDAERERLEEKYGEERVWDFIDLIHKMDRLKSEKRTAYELYYDTAGEIEARETASRLTFDEANRKRYQPRSKRENLNRDNVVFADARYSASEEVDSEGNRLSEAQQEFYGEVSPLLRDEKGRLRVLYHQTDSSFTEFDTKHEGAGNYDHETPYGIFLKPTSRDIGVKGKNQMPLYALIKNPLQVKDRHELVRVASQDSTYKKLYSKQKDIDVEYKKKYEDAKKAFDDYLSKWRKDNPEASRTAIYDDEGFQEAYDREDAVVEEWEMKSNEVCVEAKERLTEYLKEEGYDGLVIEKDEGSFGRATKTIIAFEPNQVKSITNQNPTTSSDIRHSFAGVDAVTADKSMLELANDMEQRGEDPETIRKQTGWHRGYDGKWRFEIDDSQMEILDVDSNYMRLDQLLKHDKLFEAYPILREMDAMFLDLGKYANGYTNKQAFTIVLNSNLKKDKGELKRTLIHEIQHAIQYEEGFANGTSVNYWERKLQNGYVAPNRKQKRKQELRKQYLELKEAEPEFVAEMEKHIKAEPTVPRGRIDWTTLEQIEEDPMEWQEYDAEIERLYEKYGERYDELYDLIKELSEPEYQDRRDAKDLYYDTAGELEASETAERLLEDEADRKKYPPRSKYENLDRDNVVFADASENIKYSISTEEFENLQRKHENTLRENDIFRHLIDYLERRIESTKGTEISEKSIEKVASKMFRKYKSEADKEQFTKAVAKLFKMMSEGKVNKDDFLYFAEEAMRPVLEQSKDNKQISDYARGILTVIRKTPIKIGTMAKKEASYHYGSYNDFRRSLFGRANFTDKGTDLDILWQEWASAYPELFDSETVAEDQPVRLAEIINSLKEDYDSEVGFNLDEAVTYAAMELMEEYASLTEVKNQTALKDAAEMQRNIRRLNEEYRKAYETQLKELRSEHKEKLARQEAKFRARMTQSRSSRLETQERKKYKDSIVKNTKEIMRWLEVNNDKYHVPEVLRETTIGFLGGMDFMSENGWNSQDTVMLQNRLNILYRKLSAESTKAEGDDVMADLDPDFLPTLDGLISLLEQSEDIKKIGDMDSRQLKDVAYLVGTLKRVITTANRLIANKQYQHVSQMGDSTVSFLAGLKAKKQRGKWAAMGDELLNLHMLDSKSFFGQMGEAAESLWQELRDGFNQRTWKLESAKKYMKEVVGDSRISKWTGKKAETHSFEFNGQKFDITTGQLMTLYLLSKRPQAYNHLMAGATMYSETGGFTIDAQSMVKGQKVPERRIKVTDDQMQEMFKCLTPEQIRIAKAMQKFLAKDCAEWGNEVSMTMYGYKKFGEATYWPIKTNDNFNKTDDKNAETGAANTSLYAIRNQGMTKNLVKNASNPIVVGDVFEVFAEHVANMANYNAFVIPLSDAMKWFNYRSRSEEGAVTGSIKEEMERSYGKGAKRYFINFIKDVNGEVKKGVASEISSTFTSKYKAAAVGANLRVVIQQPTSIFRAMSVMNPKYLAAGAAHGSAMQEMHENSAIATWKTWGYFETGLGQSMKQVITGEGTALEKTVELSMAGAGAADDFTWGIIWNAVKAEVKDKYKDIDISSEEYMDLVRKRFDEVIDQTQVVDTILHRSQIMRSGDGVVKMAVAFMAEPTKSYNLLHNAVRDLNQKNTAENRIKVARRAVVYAFTGIMTAAFASVLDAFRDDDEEKEWAAKWLENWKANTLENINPISQIPYLKDLSSLWQGFDTSRMDMAGISTLVNAVQQAVKYAGGDSKKTLYGVTKNIIRGLSQVTGLPMYNALRDTESLIEQFTFAPIDEDQITGKDVRIRLMRAMNEGNEKQLQKYLAWYDEQYKQKIEDGKTDKEAKSALKSSITSQWKSIYQNSATAEKIKIKNLLLKIKVNGQQLYKDYDWSDWDK